METGPKKVGSNNFLKRQAHIPRYLSRGAVWTWDCQSAKQKKKIRAVASDWVNRVSRPRLGNGGADAHMPPRKPHQPKGEVKKNRCIELCTYVVLTLAPRHL